MIETFFPGRDFKAFLFDFDGTVADTMPVHRDAWNHALGFFDLTLTLEQHLGWAGRPTREIVSLLGELHGRELPVDEIMKHKEVYYSQAAREVKGIVPVVDVVRAAHGKIPMAIVSGSRRKPVETTLRQLAMSHYFDVLVCAEDYIHGKPAPDCFLQAAAALKADPVDCLVFEDGVLGIQAAHAAGMECLRVDTHPTLGHKLGPSR
ncbi:MAG: HAD family phosphatase [Bdellovibrionota bacterium]